MRLKHSRMSHVGRVQVMLGDAQLQQMQPRVQGHYLLRDGEPWYQIKNFDNMDPFFMSIVSDTNFWMFISTTGYHYSPTALVHLCVRACM